MKVAEPKVVADYRTKPMEWEEVESHNGMKEQSNSTMLHRR